MLKEFFKQFSNRICRRPFILGNDIRNFVGVFDTNKRSTKCDDLFTGLIVKVDMEKRVLFVDTSKSNTNKQCLRAVQFDDIVTISRMRDGRLRMWIKVEEEA